MGSIFLDLTGVELSPEEREILKHPQLGGIIFFSRNYESPKQLNELVLQIRKFSAQRLLLTVDQEGGRVQRFLDGFTPLPSLGKIGEFYEQQPNEAVTLAKIHGWIMASELLALGIDLSFAPILDLDNNLNQVIGKRSFHSNPNIIVKLAHATIQGIKKAGMSTVGKHFPGHGFVTADTHTHLATDIRTYEEIKKNDLIPFTELSPVLDAIMAAHIVYNKVDLEPCGFSSIWLQTILREKLNFSGAIFTDDLSMKAVANKGNIFSRVELALRAGCDGLLICNNRKEAIFALEYLESKKNESPNMLHSDKRLQKLFPRRTLDASTLRQTTAWQDAVNLLSKLNDN
ncbi:MAG: beta-N-acetylhexosaminidase [Rickettsiella sp.]|nr:beta-N-acetylhexosaminidase [Rickettsiella sp.]